VQDTTKICTSFFYKNDEKNVKLLLLFPEKKPELESLSQFYLTKKHLKTRLFVFYEHCFFISIEKTKGCLLNNPLIYKNIKYIENLSQ